MIQVSLEEATMRLPQLVQMARDGEEVVITQQSEPAVRLISLSEPTAIAKPRAQFGSGKGSILYMAPDFDAPLEEFQEYME